MYAYICVCREQKKGKQHCKNTIEVIVCEINASLSFVICKIVLMTRLQTVK